MKTLSGIAIHPVGSLQSSRSEDIPTRDPVGTSLTITKPAGLTVGDLMVAVIGKDDDPAITTDVIAGFPGETEGAHARSVELIREIGFARVHAFPFSPRPGTPAASMPHEPGAEVARHRTAELIHAGREAAREFRKRFIGKTVDVLAEPTPEERRLAGYTERYVRIAFDGPEELVGRIARVHNLVEAGDRLEGKLAP